MRSLSKLRTLFATALGVSACGGSIDRSAFTEDVCSGAASYDPLAGVTPAVPVDYMELRQTFGLSTNPPTVVSKSGTPCAKASDPATCNASLSAVSATGWQLAPGGGLSPTIDEYLVYTRGDEVGTVTSYEALKTFLAPVDDVHDAALLVSQSPTTQYRIQCGPKSGGPGRTGGFEIVAETGDTCGQGTHLDEVLVFVSETGDVAVQQDVVIQNGDPNCVSGRRPEGLSRATRRCDDTVGAFFAECARLEAASVIAFERMARELRAHAAPARFVRAAERALGDEVRHAKVTAALAHRYGGEPEPVVVEERGVRSLVEIAIENAVEGCVRETYGALVAHHQAAHAKDARVAATMRRVAEDETRHAALAWDFSAWLESCLTADERARVAAAREDATATLRAQLAQPIAHELETTAGLPSATKALAMFDAMAPSLWAA